MLNREGETKLLINGEHHPQQQQQPAALRVINGEDDGDDDGDDDEDIKRRSSAGTYSQSSDSQPDYANANAGARRPRHREQSDTCVAHSSTHRQVQTDVVGGASLLVIGQLSLAFLRGRLIEYRLRLG